MGLFLGESSRFFVFVFGFPMDFFPFENVHIEPICSMHVIFTHMWHKFVLNVGKCSIHGAFGIMYTWNPNVPCFDWKRPSFGGKTKDKWVPGIYIYIYTYLSSFILQRSGQFLVQMLAKNRCNFKCLLFFLNTSSLYDFSACQAATCTCQLDKLRGLFTINP